MHHVEPRRQRRIKAAAATVAAHTVLVYYCAVYLYSKAGVDGSVDGDRSDGI